MNSDLNAGLHKHVTIEAYQASVERAIRHMQEHVSELLDLEHLAQIAAVSRFHFVRVFKEVTGTTPHHFLACLRVQRAKELLLSSTAPITEVCMEVGYSSLGTFSTLFNRLVGVSPQEFRASSKRLIPALFIKAAWRFLTSEVKPDGPEIEGVVEGPVRLRGFTFVGAFAKGVPQGLPLSGTVLLGTGRFRIQRPDVEEFHVLAAFIPLLASLTAIVTTLPVEWVASQRVQTATLGMRSRLRLHLRRTRLTDPPVLLALPALPPWRGAFIH